MTPNPECATLETTILEALHIMHDGKFLHLPVLDRGEMLTFCSIFYFYILTDKGELNFQELTILAEGSVVASVDVLQITHAAISMVSESMKSLFPLMGVFLFIYRVIRSQHSKTE